MGVGTSALACHCKNTPKVSAGVDGESNDVFLDKTDSLSQGLPSSERDFFAAAESGNAGLVHVLFAQGVSVNGVSGKSGKTALHVAALDGHVEVLMALLKAGIDKDAKDANKKTALVNAVERGHLEFATILTKNGATKDCLNKRLFEVSKGGENSLAKALLTCAASAVSKDKKGRTPLHIAAGNGHMEISSLLLEGKASAEIKCKDGKTPISAAVDKGEMELLQVLVDHGGRLRSNDKKSLGKQLIVAVENGDLQLTKRLQCYASSTTEHDKQGRTPILIAIQSGRMDIVAALSSKGLCPSGKESIGKLLITTCEKGDADMAKTILRCAADVDAADCFNETSAWKAACNGHLEVLRLLLQRSCDIHMTSRNCCRSPVVIALDRGRSGCVKLLLQKGAQLPDVSILSKKLRDASRLGELARAATLLDYRADVNCIDDSVETPLIKAALHSGGDGELQRTRRVDVAKLLIRKKAAVNSRGGTPKQTALWHAAHSGGLEMVRTLLENGANENGADKCGFEKAQMLLQRQSG